MKLKMKDLNKIKKGDKIRLTKSNDLIEHYITKSIFIGGLNVQNLRAVCNLKEFMYYKVVQNCVSCKFMDIKFSKLIIRIPYRFIDTSKWTKTKKKWNEKRI